MMIPELMDSNTALHLAARHSDHPAVIAALASAGAPLEDGVLGFDNPLPKPGYANQNRRTSASKSSWRTNSCSPSTQR